MKRNKTVQGVHHRKVGMHLMNGSTSTDTKNVLENASIVGKIRCFSAMRVQITFSMRRSFADHFHRDCFVVEETF